MNLKPKDGETQPDFAIRFHDTMMSEIRDTDERNQKCFEIWAEHTGEKEVEEARRYHKASDFKELRNACVFKEHEIPSQKLGNGKFRKGVKYDKYALASMVNNMNGQLLEVGKCCPLTLGHTSEDASAAQPEVIGFTGAYRLGMVGKSQPKYAIFTDEYHRKDKENIFRYSVGRSVEVLPLPDVHQRTIYPIAVLSAEEPRLDLPPVRYCNRVDESGNIIEVERYQMGLPGGNATFMPSTNMTPDKYGDSSPEQELPQNVVKSVCEAIFASEPFQYLMAKMQEDGKSGAVTPLVHQPPQMADMPADDEEQQPGQQPGMPGQPQPGASPDAGSDMGAGAPNKPPQQDAGGDPNQPPFAKEKKPMADNDKYSAEAGFKALEARIEALEAEKNSLKAKLIGSERYSKLASLKSEGYELNLDKELSRVSKQSDEEFTEHVETIKEHYRKSPTSVADFSGIAGVGRRADAPEDGDSIDQLSASDVEDVKRYAAKHQMNYIEARNAYAVEKKTRGTVAG